MQEKINNSCVEMHSEADKKSRMSPKYKIGDLVKIHHSRISRNSLYSKLEPVFLGPYLNTALYPDTDNCTLESLLVPSGHHKVHTSLLALYYQNDDTQYPSRSLPEAGPLELETQGFRWAFECNIKNKKNKRNGVVK